MKSTVFLVLISTVLLSGINAQKKWTLQECIQYALDNNIQIKRQELQTKVSEKDYQQSMFNMLPELNGNANHTWSKGRNFNTLRGEIVTSTELSDGFSINSSVPIFNGFQIKNTIKQNKYNLEQSLKDYEKAKNDISLQIATIFLQILFNQEALSVATSQLEVTKLQVERTNKLVEAGTKAKGDLLQIQAQEANEKYNVINAENNLKISYLTLAQLLELKSYDDFSVEIPDTLTVTNLNILATVDDIYKIAEVSLPEIKSAEFALKSTEKGLDITKGQLYPSLDLSAVYYTGYSNTFKKQNDETYPFFEQLSDNNNKYIRFGLSVPIFNKFQTLTNISKAKIRVNDANYNLEQTKKNLYQEIQKAHADAVAAFERYNSASEAVVSNEESFKYVQQKFDLGVVSSFDYNLAKNDLIRAKSNHIQAKYEYIFKIKVLDFYRGLPIQL